VDEWRLDRPDCQEHGIVYESYGAMRGCPFSDPSLGAIAKSLKVSPAQVCLRWALQRGATIASGTGSNATTAASYAKENLAIFDFELSAGDMTKLNNMQL
jgi:2,5-diketo-D-gluconate reductase A